MRNWDELPEDILELFLNQLSNVVDYMQFSVVCKSWRSVVLRKKERGGITFSPWLMLINDNDTSENLDYECSRPFYDIHRDKLFGLNLQQTQGRRCWGSPYGWLVTVGLDQNIHLLNPLSGAQIPLPPQPILQAQSKTAAKEEMPDFITVFLGYTEKILLTSNPSFFNPLQPMSCLVMAIFGMNCELAFTNPLSETWTRIPNTSGTQDMILYNGQVYCVLGKGIFALCEIDTISPKVTHLAEIPFRASNLNSFYLLEMFGDVLLVIRFLDGVEKKRYNEKTDATEVFSYHYETDCVRAYRFDFSTMEWIEVEELGNNALFIGNNTSFAISTTIYPEFKKNSVYYTDDQSSVYFDGYCDMGVLDFETFDIERFKVGNDVLSKFSRPCFFMPSI